MNDRIPPLPTSENLPEVLKRIWSDKKYVLWGVAFGIFIAVFLILFLKPRYEASMIVAPSLQDSRTNSFVEGVLLYSPDIEARIPTGSPEFIRFEQSLRGYSVAQLLFKMDNIVDKISEDTLWRGISNPIQSPEELAIYLDKAIQIEVMGATTSRKISYLHPDQDFAVKFLTLLRKADDQIIRTSVRAESETKINWLKKEFQKTLNPDHRQALVQLLMSEERRRMLLSLDVPYAVNVVEEASVNPRAAVPNRPVIILLMIVMGAVCGAIIALIKTSFLKNAR